MIVVGEREVEIALLLVDVGTVIVAFDIVQLDGDRDAVVGKCCAQIGLLLLLAAPRAADGGQGLVALEAAGIDQPRAGWEAQAEFSRILVAFAASEKQRVRSLSSAAKVTETAVATKARTAASDKSRRISPASKQI